MTNQNIQRAAAIALTVLLTSCQTGPVQIGDCLQVPAQAQWVGEIGGWYTWQAGSEKLVAPNGFSAGWLSSHAYRVCPQSQRAELGAWLVRVEE